MLLAADVCFWDELVNPVFNLVNRAVRAGVKHILIADPERSPFFAVAERCQRRTGAIVGERVPLRKVAAMRDLRVYERARKGHNAATQLAMDGFKHLFGSDLAGLPLLRNLGLGVAARVTPLRRLFERIALGEGIELPTLCERAPSR